MCVEKREEQSCERGGDVLRCHFSFFSPLFDPLSLPLSSSLFLCSQFARFNDTLVSLAGDDGIPFATSYETSSGEECAALCASVTAKAEAAAKKKGGGAQNNAAQMPLPRCFSAAFDVKEDGDERDGASGKTTFTCALYGWAKGEPCPEVTVETSGGTTSFLDPKALSSSLGACAGASSTSSSSSASASVSSSSPTTRTTKSKDKAAAASPSSLTIPSEANTEKSDALEAIAEAVRSSLPPAPLDPAAAASAVSAAAASLASAASGGDDTAARAQAWAAVVDAKPGAAVAVVGARPPISTKSFKNSKNLTLSFEYLGSVTDVVSAAVCSGLCQQFVAGADNAGGRILGVTEFGSHTASGKAGYYGVSDGPLQAHCVAASFYDGDAALGIDASEQPEQAVGRVCDLFGVAPRGQTVLLLEPAENEKGKGGGELAARSTVTFIRPQRWSELDYALED